MTAKELREIIEKVKPAMESAYDYFKNSENYPLLKPRYEPDASVAIADFIYTFFEFNDKGEIIGLCEPTLEFYLNIGFLKGRK